MEFNLKIIQTIEPMQEVSEYLVPASGHQYHIQDMLTTGPNSVDCSMKIVWDYEEAGEVPIWGARGDVDLNLSKFGWNVVGDGVKKLAAVVRNHDTYEHMLGINVSGYADENYIPPS